MHNPSATRSTVSFQTHHCATLTTLSFETDWAGSLPHTMYPNKPIDPAQLSKTFLCIHTPLLLCISDLLSSAPEHTQSEPELCHVPGVLTAAVYHRRAGRQGDLLELRGNHSDRWLVYAWL